MKSIYFATTNEDKLLIAKTVCRPAGIEVKPVRLTIDEIQGENPGLIIRDKARRAYELFGNPILVSDDSWDIPALNGFPGPYMKSINYWFKPEDFLRLMNGIKDRTISLHSYLAYYDGKEMKIFSDDMRGKIICEVRGRHDQAPNTRVIALDLDNGQTVAEVFENGPEAIVKRYQDHAGCWQELIKYLQSKKT